MSPWLDTELAQLQEILKKSALEAGDLEFLQQQLLDNDKKGEKKESLSLDTLTTLQKQLDNEPKPVTEEVHKLQEMLSKYIEWQAERLRAAICKALEGEIVKQDREIKGSETLKQDREPPEWMQDLANATNDTEFNAALKKEGFFITGKHPDEKVITISQETSKFFTRANIEYVKTIAKHCCQQIEDQNSLSGKINNRIQQTTEYVQQKVDTIGTWFAATSLHKMITSSFSAEKSSKTILDNPAENTKKITEEATQTKWNPVSAVKSFMLDKLCNSFMFGALCTLANTVAHHFNNTKQNNREQKPPSSDSDVEMKNVLPGGGNISPSSKEEKAEQEEQGEQLRPPN